VNFSNASRRALHGSFNPPQIAITTLAARAMADVEEPKTKITGMSDADVKNGNIDKAFDLTESGLDSVSCPNAACVEEQHTEAQFSVPAVLTIPRLLCLQLGKGVGEHGDKFVGMCTNAFGSMGGKFGGALKTGCSSMISGCKGLMPQCREQAHKLSVEAETRDFKLNQETLKPPQSAKPSMSFIKERRAEMGY
jgi:hypothetical protein